MDARSQAIRKLLSMAAERFGEPGIADMPFTIHDRGNENPNVRVYSMCYRSDRPSLKRMCGPDWTFVHWPECNITSYEETRDEVIKAGESEPSVEKACWFGNANSPTKDVIEHITRPKLVEIGEANSDVMDIRHVFPPLPAQHPEYRAMPDLVREYRAIIDIGGNGYSGRIKWLLHSRRALIMIGRGYVEYFHDDLKPWVHYIPARQDLSDIESRVRWTLNNPRTTAWIAENAFRFATSHFREERLLDRVREVWKAMKQ